MQAVLQGCLGVRLLKYWAGDGRVWCTRTREGVGAGRGVSVLEYREGDCGDVEWCRDSVRWGGHTCGCI